jgi:hypothetical protein
LKENPMTQRDLNRAVARATGETVGEIAQMGFVPLTLMPVEREPQAIDWDHYAMRRNCAVFRQPRRRTCA